MSSELAVILPDEWQVLKQQAQALVDSGFLPQSVNNVQKAVAIMTLGRELGIGAWAALNGINVIQGKPTVSPQLMLAMINAKGQLEDMRIDATDEGCTVVMKRKGRSPHTETFDRNDAAAMQLMGKDNYKKQPATMMKWRAVAACARIVFPDVILNLYTPDEMGANVIVDEQGNMTPIDIKREPTLRLAEPPPVDGEVVEASQPSASVRGAGVQKPTQEPDPLDWTDGLGANVTPLDTDTPPNVYTCDRLKVHVSRTATTFLLMTANGTNIVAPAAALVGLQVNGMFVEALAQGVYPLNPNWQVQADRDANGNWENVSVQAPESVTA